MNAVVWHHSPDHSATYHSVVINLWMILGSILILRRPQRSFTTSVFVGWMLLFEIRRYFQPFFYPSRLSCHLSNETLVAGKTIAIPHILLLPSMVQQMESKGRLTEQCRDERCVKYALFYCATHGRCCVI